MSKSSIERKLVMLLVLGFVTSSGAFAAEESAASLESATMSLGGPGGGGSRPSGGGGGGSRPSGGGGGGGGSRPSGGGGGGGSRPSGGGGGGSRPAPPSRPSNPTRPTQPTGGNAGNHNGGTRPTQPTRPSNPTRPTQPTGGNAGNHNGGTRPTQPTRPSNPTRPTQPTGGNAGNHNGGTRPTQPTRPSNPTRPTQPTGGNAGNSHGPSNAGHVNHGSMARDKHGNTVTHDHKDRVTSVTKRGNDLSKRNAGYKNSISHGAHEFRNRGGFRDQGREREGHYRGYYDHWRGYYSGWYGRGFCGGFYWGFNPYWNIDNYFWNPSIYWFYNNYDPVVYQTWYGNDYVRYPELHVPFRRVGIFLPTEEFKDLALDVTGLSTVVQVNFRSSMEILADRLDEQLVLRSGGNLRTNDVVVNHYQTLPNDAGVVVEGVVASSSSNVQFAYKAILDFNNAAWTMVFAPQVTADGNPSPDDEANLAALNSRIEALGGAVETGK